MIFNVKLSNELEEVIKKSKKYQSNFPLTVNELHSITQFAYFYSTEDILNLIKNEENILYGFCYAEYYNDYYWMFLDEDFKFYDIKIPKKGKISKQERKKKTCTIF